MINTIFPWSYNFPSCAYHITWILWQRHWIKPYGSARGIQTENSSTYGSQSLIGVLRVCADQTANLVWFSIFDEVEQILGLPKFVRGVSRDDDFGLENAAQRYRTLTGLMLQVSLDFYPPSRGSAKTM